MRPVLVSYIEKITALSGTRKWGLGGLTALLLAYGYCLPEPLFRVPYSVVLEDRDGGLLSARIASDGQWRFPVSDSLPSYYVEALLAFEDKRFFYHPGIDPIAFSRAVWQNLRAGRIVSGGSTLSMQVVRLARGQKPRTLPQKLIEIVLATRLELRYSKREILRLYAAHAPCGGNVVGIDAAAWRYFGKAPGLLSKAECALLAVLPNSPSLLHPGRNRRPLLEKRNRLLRTLARKGLLDAPALELALAEPLPEAPLPLPSLAPHLIEKSVRDGGPPRIRTTLDAALQTRALEVAQRRQATLKHNGIFNLAALIADVESGSVLAYVGNAPNAGAAHGVSVDIISASRSSGSIFKPFLYTMALQEGLILPKSLLHDVPTNIHGYRPENFHRDHDGLVAADEALSRSLNIPFVRLLRDYDIARFHRQLQQIGLRTITRPPEDYGLTLILGGAEASLWDVAGVYASMARTLNHFPGNHSRYTPSDFRPLEYYTRNERRRVRATPLQRPAPFMDAGALWFAIEAMKEVQRPDSEGNWEVFQSSRRIAWKTGTSFGYRDAWSIGITPDYLVAVWVGNADGEGRPGLVGTQVAAPFMFELFGLLPGGNAWFPKPFDALVKTAVCRDSGWPAGPYCRRDTTWAPSGSTKTPACTYCQRLHLDAGGNWQVHSGCESPSRMTHRNQMVLPALEAFYYMKKHPNYTFPPSFRPDCSSIVGSDRPMQLIYPLRQTRIFVPTDLDGESSMTVFKLAHILPDATVYWHLGDTYLGFTKTFHQMALRPPPGKHKLTLVDDRGNRLEQWFEVVVRQEN